MARIIKTLIRPTYIVLALIYSIINFGASDIYADEYHAEIIELEAGDYQSEIEELREQGVIVLRNRDELALCLIPVNHLPESRMLRHSRLKAEHPGERKHSVRGFTVPTLRTAHQWYNAHEIHKGVNDTPYTGKGVVVGFCDLGFDASHIAFRRPDGTSRVVRSVQYVESEGLRIVCDTPEAIRQWQTDRDTHTHATHVAGIMAGSYTADGLGGAAPEADIVATTSELTEVGLLAGVEDIIEYAHSEGKPCVINLSVGNYLGPHDGTSLFSRYLDKCGNDAIICISSGNEGNSLNTFDITFSETRPEMTFRLTSLVGLNLELYGAVDFWMTDDTPLTVAPMVVDSTNNKIVCELPTVDFTSTPIVLIVTDSNGESTDNIPGVSIISSPELSRYFEGNILLTGERDSYNSRYHVTMEYNITTDIKTEGKPWGRYLLGGRAASRPGAHADIYVDGIYSAFSRFPGANCQPGSIHSISDLATGHNVLCVGMYNNNKELKMHNGEYFTVNEPIGEISSYSGYGTLIDGRILPHTSAPGMPVESAYSSPFLANPDNVWHLGRTTLAARGDGKPTDISITPDMSGIYHPEYFYWGPDGGTSMSTPYVAGYIATWLQANPDLNINDVKGIISHTNDSSDHCDYTYNPRNGQGFFRPVEGLREAKFLSTRVTPALASESRIRLIGDVLHVSSSANPSNVYTLDIIDITGFKCCSYPISSDYEHIDLSGLNPGIYIATFGENAFKFSIH